jgi:translation initiation factor IF-2
VAKKRVHEIAKQEGLTSKDVIAALKAAGIEVKAAASSVEESDALAALKSHGDGAAPAEPKAKPKAKPKAEKPKAEKPVPEKRVTKPVPERPRGEGSGKVDAGSGK